MKLTLSAICRDGGTKMCIGEDGRRYFIDYRISTATRGGIYDKYPVDEGATLLTYINNPNVELIDATKSDRK